MKRLIKIALDQAVAGVESVWGRVYKFGAEPFGRMFGVPMIVYESGTAAVHAEIKSRLIFASVR